VKEKKQHYSESNGKLKRLSRIIGLETGFDRLRLRQAQPDKSLAPLDRLF
jgi:hypothetical protein